MGVRERRQEHHKNIHNPTLSAALMNGGGACCYFVYGRTSNYLLDHFIHNKTDNMFREQIKIKIK